MEKIGLIVGNGKFPLYFIEEAKNSNISLYPIGLFPSVDEEIKGWITMQSSILDI